MIKEILKAISQGIRPEDILSAIDNGIAQATAAEIPFNKQAMNEPIGDFCDRCLEEDIEIPTITPLLAAAFTFARQYADHLPDREQLEHLKAFVKAQGLQGEFKAFMNSKGDQQPPRERKPRTPRKGKGDDDQTGGQDPERDSATPPQPASTEPPVAPSVVESAVQTTPAAPIAETVAASETTQVPPTPESMEQQSADDLFGPEELPMEGKGEETRQSDNGSQTGAATVDHRFPAGEYLGRHGIDYQNVSMLLGPDGKDKASQWASTLSKKNGTDFKVFTAKATLHAVDDVNNDSQTIVLHDSIYFVSVDVPETEAIVSANYFAKIEGEISVAD